MERTISEKIDPSHYRADACVVWCFDDRFSELLQKLIAAKGWKRADIIKVAGGAKGLASPASEAEREYLLDQIAKSVKLHQPPTIALMVHADCGAYGKKFSNDEEEFNFHKNELGQAGAAVGNFLSGKGLIAEIKKYYADFKGLVEI